MIRPRALLGLVVVAAVAVGCGGGSSAGSAAPVPTPSATHTATHHPSSPPVTVTASTSATATVTASPSTNSAPATAPCASSQLKLSLGQGQGTAGSFYTPLILSNASHVTCTLLGYPGVSYLDASGKQLGLPASRSSGHAHTVTLKPGRSASALLHQPDPAVFPPADCRSARAAAIRVYPPGQQAAIGETTSLTVCTTKAGRSDIGPMQAGVDPQQ